MTNQSVRAYGVSFNSKPERMRFVVLMKTIQEFSPIGSRGLDVGCGESKLIRVLNSLEYDVLGLDSESGYINNEHVSLDCTENLQFDSEEFDFIILSNVLAHVANLQRAMDELYRVFRPNGVMYIIQSNRIGWKRIMSFHIRKTDRHYHLRAFTRWKLWNLLVTNRFAPIEFRIPFWFYFHSNVSEYFNVLVQKTVSSCSKLKPPDRIRYFIMFHFGILISPFFHSLFVLLEFIYEIKKR